MSKDAQRNQMIVADVEAAIEASRKPFALTERTEHVTELARLLGASRNTVITLIDAMSSKEKRAINEQLTELQPKDRFVLIATGRYVGEGFDLPMLDTLFIALPIAFKGRVAQYTGRIHRLVEGKGDVCVYDYVDIHLPPQITPNPACIIYRLLLGMEPSWLQLSRCASAQERYCNHSST